MSSSGIRFLPALTESGLREFLYPSTSTPMDEEPPSSPQPPSLAPENVTNIPPSPEVVLQCRHLASNILTFSDPTAQSHWVHELITLTFSLSSQLTASRNALHMEAERSADVQTTSDELRKNLAVTEEALAATVSMLTEQTAKVASARSSLRNRAAEIHAKDLEIQKMKESTKLSISANSVKNDKAVSGIVGCASGGRDRGGDSQTDVSTDSGEGAGNLVGRKSRSNVDSRGAHEVALEKALLEKTELLKEEERRAAGLRKLLNSAVEELGRLKTHLAEVTDTTRPPLPEIPRYRQEGLCTPTGRERLRLRNPNPANNNKDHRCKQTVPRQRTEWIFGEEAKRALSTAAPKTEAKEPFVVRINEGDTTWSHKRGDPFVRENQGTRYMTFPPEVAPKSYRPGAGRRRGNAFFAV
ncbi:hypothetical protein C7212DRAFT_344582 [Tuber magnatum]|uniref:Uncharacterized protein n=1 Tax=Tuber magnatum TaxID=42249 RepID=A0A317SNT7_9PEZI|nr:hypothetical protein C7212DRAFT_344582 [Tuber magnatum]